MLIPDAKVKRKILSDLGFKQGKIRISIGDRTTERLIELGLRPDIAVIDGIERRSRRPLLVSEFVFAQREKGKIVEAKNPAGSITDDAIKTLLTSLQWVLSKKGNKSLVKIKGEEDLLALPMIAFCPVGSIVLYGQPREGLVFVLVNRKTKQFSKNFLNSMGIRGF